MKIDILGNRDFLLSRIGEMRLFRTQELKAIPNLLRCDNMAEQKWLVISAIILGAGAWAWSVIATDTEPHSLPENKRPLFVKQAPFGQGRLLPRTEDGNGAKDKSGGKYFTPSSEFKPPFPGWRPFNGVSIRPEAQEAMQLNDLEFQQLKEAIGSFLGVAAKLQAEDAYVAERKTSDGSQIMLIVPKPEKWAGVEMAFKHELERIVGREKANYFTEVSKNDIDIATGRFGSVTRSVFLSDVRDIKAGVLANSKDPEMAEGFFDFNITIQDGSGDKLFYAGFFPAQVNNQLPKGEELWIPGAISQSVNIDDAPEYLRPLIEKFLEHNP